MSIDRACIMHSRHWGFSIVTNSIYLVLDMENDLVHVDGSNGKALYGEQARARRIVENTRSALDKARAAGLRLGHDRDYEMVLLEDCCCALSAEEHESAIKLLQRFCKITSSKDVAFE
jgi:nicotinamidase-related amidase